MHTTQTSLPRRRGVLATLFAVASLLAGAALAHAAASDLDPTFGTGGKVTTSIGAGGDSVQALAIQQDGKIVVAGYAYNGSNDDFALARYNPDGSPDTSFDGDGMLTTAFGTGNDAGQALAIQQDGKIVVAGYAYNGSNYDFALARYNPDGSPDASFDTDGKLTTVIGAGTDIANALALQQDGKIVVAGYAVNGSSDDFAAARYNPDGSRDTNFDGDGRLTTAIGAGDDQARALAIQPDGRIIVAGQALVGSNNDFAVTRYNPDGSLDTSFDGDGRLTTPVQTGNDFAHALAVQQDGKIVVAGEAYSGSNYDFALTRYDRDGSLDASFNYDGKLTTAIGTDSDVAHALAIQQDGKIVAAGTALIGTYDFALVRYNPDGSLDTGFDDDGKLRTAIGTSTDEAQALALQQDGKIVVAGKTFNGGTSDFALVRYLGDPPPQPPAQPAPPSSPGESPGPSATVSAPARGKISREKLKALAGTAGPAGQVAKVEIALRKIDGRQLKRKRCLWLRNARAGFAKVRARGKRCDRKRFLTASGTESWHYKLARPLARGSYELFVRVTLASGQAHTTFTAAEGNYRRFVVR